MLSFSYILKLYIVGSLNVIHFPYLFYCDRSLRKSGLCTSASRVNQFLSRNLSCSVYFLNSRKNAQFFRVNVRFSPRMRVYAGCTVKNFQTRVAEFSSRVFTRVAAIRCTALYNIFYLISSRTCGRESSFFFFSRVPVPRRSMELSTE